MDKMAHNRKRHKSETNCKRCLSLTSSPVPANFLTSADDCIPLSLAFYSGSTFSNCASMSGGKAACDVGCSPPDVFKNSFYSSPFVSISSSSITTFPSFSKCTTSSSSCSTTFSSRSSSFASSSSSVLSDKCNLRLSISSSSDDDIASSPDSGFESTASNGSSSIDYFDNFKSDDSIDDLSKSSTSSFPPEHRLCLIPPPKPEAPLPVKEAEPKIFCKWRDCGLSFSSFSLLHEHLSTTHISASDKRICCLWHECRVYEKPARSTTWLRSHISTHTRAKRFKCILDGCGASFSSQQGLARHVPSHFSEVNLPKARLAGHAERKCLVKRRKIKDEKKALANIHDVMDRRSVDMIVNSLVEDSEKFTSSSALGNISQVTCTRRCGDGSVWNLQNDNKKPSIDVCVKKLSFEDIGFALLST